MKPGKLDAAMLGLFMVSAVVLAAAAVLATKGVGFSGRLLQLLWPRQPRPLLPVLAPPCGKGSCCPTDVNQEANSLIYRDAYVVLSQNRSGPPSGSIDASLTLSMTGRSGHLVADMTGPGSHNASPSNTLPVKPSSVQEAGVQLVTPESLLPHPPLPRIRTR
jgi:hypothetical protein